MISYTRALAITTILGLASKIGSTHHPGPKFTSILVPNDAASRPDTPITRRNQARANLELIFLLNSYRGLERKRNVPNAFGRFRNAVGIILMDRVENLIVDTCMTVPYSKATCPSPFQ